MVVPLIAAKKGSETAVKALTGDIYTRQWTSVRGSGKKKTAVEHTVHFNPLMLGIGAAAAATALALGGLGLWFTQRKLGRTDGHDMVLVIDQHDATYTDKVVIDVPAIPGYWTNIKYTPIYVEPVPAVTHIERVYNDDGYFDIKSPRGILYKRVKGYILDFPDALTVKQRSNEYVFQKTIQRVTMPWGIRKWWLYHTEKKGTFGIGEREGSIFNVDIM